MKFPILCCLGLFSHVRGETYPTDSKAKVYSSEEARRHLLPQVLKPFQFGCTLAEFERLNPDFSYQEKDGQLYGLTLVGKNFITAAGANFEKEPPHRMSQLIVSFESQTARDVVAEITFGDEYIKDTWVLKFRDGNNLVALREGELNLVYCFVEGEQAADPQDPKKVRYSKKDRLQAINGTASKIAKTSTSKNTILSNGSYSVSNIGVKVISKGDSYVKITFKYDVENIKEYSLEPDLEFVLLDKDGYQLETFAEYDIKLAPYGSATVTKDKMVRRDVWDEVKSYNVQKY
ncbi:hypothetical protein ACFPK9_04980 [Rubritalea spongiae]|uniref:Uncharacterized protein n=1 Tax=Rubritalea spongiae TaxID=430797 RepID=A0ABW5E677_9BACT